MMKIQKLPDNVTPIHEKRSSSKQKIELNEVSNSRIQELFRNELFTLKQLWEDLGVTENFKKLFLKISTEIDSPHIKIYFDLEIKHLKTLSESLKV